VLGSFAAILVMTVTGLVAVTGSAGASTQAPVSGHVTVTPAVHHDTSLPLRDMAPSRTVGHAHPALRGPVQASGPVVHAKDTSGTPAGPPRIPSPTVNFDGIAANGSAPPDNNGAPGLTQYVELVNTKYAVYSKTGSLLLGPLNTNTLWSGFGGQCQTSNDGDGMVLWDAIAQRWVAEQFAVSASPFLICVAISTGTDATGSYNRYSFSYSTIFPDYPKIGVWPDAYYVTFNRFNSSGTWALGTEICAFDRTKMLAGAAATQQCFTPFTTGTHTYLPANFDGTILPPAGEPNFEVGLSTSANNLSYFRFHVDWTTPANSTLTGPTNLAVNAFALACGGGACIPQSGTTQRLDSLGDRVMNRLAYRNFGDHESLAVTHSITAGSSVGARWYELRVGSGNSLSVFQQGTYAPDSQYRWMGSIAMDQSGDMALGYSISSGTTHPGIDYTGRLPTDPAGQMPQGEGNIFTGNGSQTTGLSRWGDYSQMSIDPSDDCTFWYINEYIPSNGTFNWHTRIGAFKFSSCGVADDFSISANPNQMSLNPGDSGQSLISTTVTKGNAQTVTLSVSGLPTDATGSFDANPIQSGQSSNLTIDTAADTPPGTYTVTVTGTGTEVTHTTPISLTINGSGTQLLGNPGFETGTAAPWVVNRSAIINDNPAEPPHSGSWDAWMGGLGKKHKDTLYQQVAIPASGSVSLTFFLHIDTAEGSGVFDTMKVQIRNSSNTVLKTLATYSNQNANSGYVQKTFDVTSFAGQTIRVFLLAKEDASAQTSFVVDDFALTAQGPFRAIG
jgi:hypothetical protein